MNKNIILVVALLVILIILGVIFFWPKFIQAPVETPVATGAKGITVFSPQPNDIVASPIHIAGTVDGEGWIGFEGQVGTVSLVDGGNNVLALGILSATTDWMKFPVSFEVNLPFTDSVEGVQSLIFKNENPSGEPERDRTFIVPVKSQNSVDYQNNADNKGK